MRFDLNFSNFDNINFLKNLSETLSVLLRIVIVIENCHSRFNYFDDVGV